MSRPPRPAPPPPAPGLTRRTALGSLAGFALLGTSACSVISGDAAKRQRDRQRAREQASTAAGPEQDPDVELAVRVLALEIGVLELAEATVAAFPAAADLLGATVDVHAAHIALLEDAAPDAPPSAETADASPALGGSTADGSPSDATSSAIPTDPTDPTASPDDDPAAVTVPDRRPAAFRQLARAEEELALALKQSAFSARSGGFARLLASMAAAAGQQAYVLRAALPGGAP